jgi:pyruvate,orthophosphate dikinase
MTNRKRVFFFGDGKAEGRTLGREILGGKGYGLVRMTGMGVPVPPGFVISTEVCSQFSRTGKYPRGLREDVEAQLRRLERLTGKRFGDRENPLLVSVRSGAPASMPGMMDTILNLGLTHDAKAGFGLAAGERFARDCRRRLIAMYGDVVMKVPREGFERAIAEARRKAGVQSDSQLSAQDLRALCTKYLAIIRKRAGRDFPEDPREQLWGAIGAVFQSWNNDRARAYRKLNRIPETWGTAVTVQAMVFGNLGDDCATGVAFTRNPSTGEKTFYGEFLPNAQGEDVVAGIRTPHPIASRGAGDSLEETMPAIYGQLLRVRDALERNFGDMQDIEFTIERGHLYILQTRNGKRTGFAAVRIACDLVEEKRISRKQALLRVEPEQLLQLLAPIFPVEEKNAAVEDGRMIGQGLPAGPGAACGRAAFSAERAVEMAQAGDPVLLVRAETSPEDILGMSAARGILTSRGGMTSHAAVVARGMGKPCVVGCGEISIDPRHARMVARGRAISEGEFLSLDGTTGEVLLGQLSTRPSEVTQVLVEKRTPVSRSLISRHFARLLSWADDCRKLGVRANADTPHDARVALAFGAEGIGLCRTEHMFFLEERIAAVREMILADSGKGRKKALAKILPMQRSDFLSIFREMGDRPVTIRLLDPPLHEFLPREAKALSDTARGMGVSVDVLQGKVEGLSEANPMLGHRGCRLGITHPEIYEMQVRAILEAAVAVARRGRPPRPEIMIPLVGTVAELSRLRRMADRVAAEVFRAKGRKVPYSVGTMIEIPRAALVAGGIAEHADFFSFGTNDLTQMTFGYSRDDAASFLPDYLEAGILPHDPFATIDEEGVGALVAMGTRRGRASKPALKVGICGEHGGDAESIDFFHRTGLDYVSCSPYRVPIARLAAARAALSAERVSQTA